MRVHAVSASRRLGGISFGGAGSSGWGGVFRRGTRMGKQVGARCRLGFRLGRESRAEAQRRGEERGVRVIGLLFAARRLGGITFRGAGSSGWDGVSRRGSGVGRQVGARCRFCCHWGMESRAEARRRRGAKGVRVIGLLSVSLRLGGSLFGMGFAGLLVRRLGSARSDARPGETANYRNSGRRAAGQSICAKRGPGGGQPHGAAVTRPVERTRRRTSPTEGRRLRLRRRARRRRLS